MTYGPIDFLALEFEGNKFKGDILLAQMHTAAVLSDEEFAAAKQRLLAGG